MTDLDRLILRTWSALEARGIDGTAPAIAAYISVETEGVAKRMAALRACGQLPWLGGPERAA